MKTLYRRTGLWTTSLISPRELIIDAGSDVLVFNYPSSVRMPRIGYYLKVLIDESLEKDSNGDFKFWIIADGLANVDLVIVAKSLYRTNGKGKVSVIHE